VSEVSVAQHAALGKGELKERVVGYAAPIDNLIDDVLAYAERQHTGYDAHRESLVGGKTGQLGELLEGVFGIGFEAAR